MASRAYDNYQIYASNKGIQNTAAFMYQQDELIKERPEGFTGKVLLEYDHIAPAVQGHNILTKFFKDNKLSGDYEYRTLISKYEFVEYEELNAHYTEYDVFMNTFEDKHKWNLANLKPSDLETAFPMGNYFYKVENGKVKAKTADEARAYADEKIAAAATQKEKDEISNFVRNIGTIYGVYSDREVKGALKRFSDGSIDKPVFDLSDPNDPYYVVKTVTK